MERIKQQSRVTVGKYGGDDAYSWAVFVDGVPAATGLSRPEVAYHRKAIVALVSRGSK